MKLRYIFKLLFDDMLQKKVMVILLLLMSSISIYMTDVIATRHFSNKYRIDAAGSMFQADTGSINYVSYLNMMSADYTTEIGQELIDYIRGHSGVLACGRFNTNKTTINGELVKTLVIEKDIVGMGNLLLPQEDIHDIEAAGGNVAYSGYNYRNAYKKDMTFDYYKDSSNTGCKVAGSLKRGASWPVKGKLSGAVGDVDSYTLDDKLVVITADYEQFDNSGGMPDIPYYIVDNMDEADSIKHDIISWAAGHNLGVNIVNVADEINADNKANNITADSSFGAEILLFILALISMSSASIVSCLLNRQHIGIMSACGISKKCIIAVNYLENIVVILIPEIIIWIICERKIFGRIFVTDINGLDMISYSYWFAHCICVPVIYIIMIIVVSFAAGIIPAIIISAMNVSQAIKPVD